MKFRTLFASAVLVTMSSGARAVTIERTFDIMASDFEYLHVYGPDTPAPIDPVELNFTVIFNTSALIKPTTTGLTINSFTLPNPPYSSAFAYDGAGTLTVATLPNPGSCSNPPNSYCIFIKDAAGASPSPDGFIESTSSAGYWVSQSTTVTASAITIVPEPSTWALMLAGFAGLSALAIANRRRALIGRPEPSYGP
jgi:hypothetical protein